MVPLETAVQLLRTVKAAYKYAIHPSTFDISKGISKNPWKPLPQLCVMLHQLTMQKNSLVINLLCTLSSTKQLQQHYWYLKTSQRLHIVILQNSIHSVLWGCAITAYSVCKSAC